MYDQLDRYIALAAWSIIPGYRYACSHHIFPINSFRDQQTHPPLEFLRLSNLIVTSVCKLDINFSNLLDFFIWIYLCIHVYCGAIITDSMCMYTSPKTIIIKSTIYDNDYG